MIVGFLCTVVPPPPSCGGGVSEPAEIASLSSHIFLAPDCWTAELHQTAQVMVLRCPQGVRVGEIWWGCNDEMSTLHPEFLALMLMPVKMYTMSLFRLSRFWERHDRGDFPKRKCFWVMGRGQEKFTTRFVPEGNQDVESGMGERQTAATAHQAISP